MGDVQEITTCPECLSMDDFALYLVKPEQKLQEPCIISWGEGLSLEVKGEKNENYRYLT